MLVLNKLPLFVGLVSIAVVLGKDLRGNDASMRSVMGDNIRSLLEKIRERMHMDMMDTMGIPRLDPFTADSLVLDSSILDMGDLGLGDFKIHLTDVLAVGLNQFVVDDADLQLAGLGFHLDLSIPNNLTITGNHVSDGMLGGLFSLKGSGPFSLIITGLHIKLDGTINYAASHWTVPVLNIDFGVEKLYVDFQGIEKMGDLLNELLSATGPEMLRELWPDVEPMLVSVAKEMVEEMLVGLSLFDLISILNGTRDIFPPITDS